MQTPTLIVPGFHGSGPEHWQTWLEQVLPDAQRVSGIDWEQPVLAHWAARVRAHLDQAHSPLWVVAHSFGCLASVIACCERPQQVAGLMLVAPADPERFSTQGLATDFPRAAKLKQFLPQQALGVPALMVASSNDPWLSLQDARHWARLWACRLHNIGAQGHINADSGHGRWEQGLQLLQELQASDYLSLPRGSLEQPKRRTRSNSQLARLRHATRLELAF